MLLSAVTLIPCILHHPGKCIPSHTAGDVPHVRPHLFCIWGGGGQAPGGI